MSKSRVGKILIPLCALGAGLMLSGCYTQLYTRGYAQQAAYGRPGPQADTLAPGDTLRDSMDARTIIVNNYYESAPDYRGYSHWDWNYPVVSFGFYSSRYRSYCDPYWWDDPWYRGRYRGHRGHYDGHSHGYPSGGGSGGGSSGPYKGDKRIYSPTPDYPAPNKGRRRTDSEESSQPPAQKVSAESSSSSSSSGSSSSPSSGGSSQGASESASKKENKDAYPTLRKGRR